MDQHYWLSNMSEDTWWVPVNVLLFIDVHNKNTSKIDFLIKQPAIKEFYSIVPFLKNIWSAYSLKSRILLGVVALWKSDKENLQKRFELMW